MFKRFKNMQERWREREIKRLRPGRDEQELLTIIRRAEAISSEEDRESLESFISFHEIRVREIMTPRPDIVYTDQYATVQETCEKMLQAHIVRMPVVDGSLDHIVGIIHIRELFAALVEQRTPPLVEMVLEPIWVSELEKVSSLLSRMRSQSHAAIVRDEFGGTAGLVTLSDLLGEIFGPLSAEEEEDMQQDICHTENGILVSARVRIEDLEDTITLPKHLLGGDFDTLGGLIITHTGRIPQQGEDIQLDGLSLSIEQASPRRIEKIRIKTT
jgi:putative hemolysin